MNQIVINIDEFQSRAAIIEDEKVVEVLIEREEERRINANIYKGKVANVLPGMESAFVNIGLEKNAFFPVPLSDFSSSIPLSIWIGRAHV